MQHDVDLGNNFKKGEHFVFNFVFHIFVFQTVAALENEMCLDFLLFYVGSAVFFILFLFQNFEIEKFESKHKIKSHLQKIFFAISVLCR